MDEFMKTLHFIHDDQATEIPIQVRHGNYVVQDMRNGDCTIHIATKLCRTLNEAKRYAQERYEEFYTDDQQN